MEICTSACCMFTHFKVLRKTEKQGNYSENHRFPSNWHPFIPVTCGQVWASTILKLGKFLYCAFQLCTFSYTGASLSLFPQVFGILRPYPGRTWNMKPLEHSMQMRPQRFHFQRDESLKSLAHGRVYRQLRANPTSDT